MKNREKWVPSKFVYKGRRLCASRCPKDVGVGSILAVDIVATLYNTFIPQYVKGKLIDLGCGKVPLFEVYKKFVTDNVCVDWQNTLYKNDYSDLECDLTKRLPFEDCEFDTIILSDVLEHIPNPEDLWLEMSRIMKSKGKILINVPFYYSLHESPHDYYRYTEYALKRFAKMADLEILHFQAYGGTPEILADVLAKHFLLFPLVGKPLAVLIQNLMGIFVRSNIGKTISMKTSKQFPFGYFMVVEKTRS